MLLLLLCAGTAGATERWFLELREPGIDEGVVRRTVALELREVDIPGDPARSGETEQEVSLFIRVVKEQQHLQVSLWDRGEFVGTRTVSDSGQPQVKARRVGLAVGELARQLRTRRIRAARLMAREEELKEEQLLAARSQTQLRALGLKSALETTIIPGEAYLLGPTLGFEFNNAFPLRFLGQVGWSAGGITVLKDASLGQTTPHWSQLDFSVGAAWVIPRGRAWQLSLGGLLTASAVHVGGGVSVDHLPSQSDTWSSRAGLRMSLSRRLSPLLWLHFDATGGTLLRPIPVQVGAESSQVGGPFVGLSLGVSLAPPATH